MNMMVSGISEHEGKKRAFVRFEEGKAFAEATIPDCKVLKSEGFSADEIQQLEAYLADNLSMLKGKAAESNPIRAMMKNDK